jgi:hypothetical protein
MFPEYLGAAYDNLVLGCLYEALYRLPFAPDSAGTALGSSLTVTEIRRALSEIGDAAQLEAMRRRFQESRANIMRLAEREGVRLVIPKVLPIEEDAIC